MEIFINCRSKSVWPHTFCEASGGGNIKSSSVIRSNGCVVIISCVQASSHICSIAQYSYSSPESQVILYMDTSVVY